MQYGDSVKTKFHFLGVKKQLCPLNSLNIRIAQRRIKRREKTFLMVSFNIFSDFRGLFASMACEKTPFFSGIVKSKKK